MSQGRNGAFIEPELRAGSEAMAASITITLDRYGHLMPGNEEHAADLLDAFLAAAQA